MSTAGERFCFDKGKVPPQWGASGGSSSHVICSVNVCVAAEDGDRKRVPAAVGDGLSDQRVVQHHPERHRQAGESQNTHTHFQFTTSLVGR